MKLKSLDIRLLNSWEDDAGKYKASVTYEMGGGVTTLILDPEVSTNLLGYLGPVITEFSRRASVALEKQIEQSIIEAKALPQIEMGAAAA